MKTLIFLLCLLPCKIWAQSGFVDQNLDAPVAITTSQFYSFDSTFGVLESKVDLALKVRLSKFGTFSHESKKLTGEMLMSRGELLWRDAHVQNLQIQDFQGDLKVTGGRIEYSELRELKLTSFVLRNVRIQNSIWSDVVAKDADFKDVVFNETNFQVSLPGLKAENVKFLGRTGAMNLRGCNLRNVEFNFDRIEYLSFTECRLENVFVNGMLLTDGVILKGE